MAPRSVLPTKYKQLFESAHSGNETGFSGQIKALSEKEGLGWSPIDAVYPKSGDGILHVICRAGHVHLLRYLRQQTSNDNNFNWAVRNFDGKTPLHDACQSGQAEVTEFLLTQLQPGRVVLMVNALKLADWTPLMLACTKPGNGKVVELLLKHGARPELKNKDGWNAFHLVTRKGERLMQRWQTVFIPSLKFNANIVVTFLSLLEGRIFQYRPKERLSNDIHTGLKISFFDCRKSIPPVQILSHPLRYFTY